MEFDIKPVVKIREPSSKLGGPSLNLYKNPPFGQLTLEECEDLFRQRIEALNIFEKYNDKQNELHLDEKYDAISNSLREIKSDCFKSNCLIPTREDGPRCKQDHFAHMLARMYCVYNSSLWTWFKGNERRLLQYRLRKDCIPSGTQLENILKGFNFDFNRLSVAEIMQLKQEGLVGWNMKDAKDMEDIFSVKFTDALKFVAKRSVSLKDGFAFLTRHEILSVVCDVFEKHLDRELNFARQHLNVEHPQTQQLLESLDMVYKDYEEKILEQKRRSKAEQDGGSRNPYRMSVDDLDELSKTHYPPCMRFIHESLMEDHHLKHQGRLTYGTFLRSGGVDMDEAIEFWRKEFTKKIANDKFERDYKYNIRHLYGREGHKKALSCFSCDKIINDNPPGPTDKHGCPFKHFDDNHLKTMLTKHGLKQVDIESIMMHRNDKDYKLACSHYFKFTKGELPSEPIKNPMHFYYESKRLANRPAISEEVDGGDQDRDQNVESAAQQDNIQPAMDIDEDKFDDDL